MASFKNLALVCAVLLIAAPLASAQCSGAKNTHPINTNEPKVAKSTKNGVMMTIDGSITRILHLYGTPEEMGEAAGELYKEDLEEFFPAFWSWVSNYLVNLAAEYVPIVKYFSKPLNSFVQALSRNLLDFQWWLSEDYIAQYYKDEMKGMATASGVDERQFIRIGILPETLKMACSTLGAWGPATKEWSDGGLLHIRALEWALNSPINKLATFIVYHPEEGNGNTFAVWSWVGFVGAVTGFSSANLGISEKMSGYDGTYTRIGHPTTMVMRDVVNFDTTREEAVRRLYAAKRTNCVWLGLGDDTGFNLVKYHTEDPEVYDNSNFTDYHPPIDHVMYISRDAGHYQCYESNIKKYYGKITPALLASDFVAMEKTGPTHVAIFDYANKKALLAAAGIADAQGNSIPAYDMPYVQVDMAAHFAKKREDFPQ